MTRTKNNVTHELFSFLFTKSAGKVTKSKGYKKRLKCAQKFRKVSKNGFLRIGDTIGACQKTQCLPYEVFFVGLKS